MEQGRKERRKLYIEPQDALSAKVEQSVWLVATVICLCIGAALALLAIDFARKTSVVAAVIVGIIALAGLVCGFAALGIHGKYKKAYKRLRVEEAADPGSNPETGADAEPVIEEAETDGSR